jgi:large subunit ribosomal protein L23
MDIYSVIIRPIITEKATNLNSKLNQVTFEVALNANKKMIKEAVEKIFNVKVEKVRTIVCRGKKRLKFGRLPFTTKKFKKAIVTLKSGKIDFLK